METPLSSMILQPNSLQISNDKDCQRMTEVWKGPWSVLKDLTNIKDKSVFGVKLYPGIIRPSAMDSSTSWKKEFDTPVASISAKTVEWLIDTVETKQIEAGDYGELTITYSSVRQNSSGGGQNADIPGDCVQTQPTVWSLNWGTFTRSPLEYAQDVTGGTAEDIKNCYENDHPGSVAEAVPLNPQVDADNLKYAYYMGTEDINREIKILVDNGVPESTKIYEYLCKGITPQFHYPIVSKQDHFFLSSGFVFNVTPGVDIDKKQSLPASCPYQFNNNWQWLKTDDSYQITQNTFEGTTYTRTQTWTGAKIWDDNFYGDNPWPLPGVQDNGGGNGGGEDDGGDVQNSDPSTGGDDVINEQPPENPQGGGDTEPEKEPEEELVINVPVNDKPVQTVRFTTAKANGEIVKYDDLPANTYIYRTSRADYYLVKDYSATVNSPKSKGWSLRGMVERGGRAWNALKQSKALDGFYDSFSTPVPNSAKENLQKDLDSGAFDLTKARNGGKWFPDSIAVECEICGGKCPLGDPKKCGKYRAEHNIHSY